ncbi:MAG: hypothetical protein K2N85_08565, partial [Lachnospiraceae bacterium]|nr:hypothetical protein [Lachnospiraceae bacterium]
LVLGFSGILQSHILSIAIAAGFCIVTALVFVVNIWKEKRYVEIGKAAGITILLNLWFLVPFLQYYLNGNLNTNILRWSGFFEQSVNPSFLTQTISLYNKQYFSLGLPLLGCAGMGVLYLVCEKKGNKPNLDKYLNYLLVMGFVLIYMMTGYFPGIEMCKNDFLRSILTMIQFPWRFLGPAGACFLFVGSLRLSESEILKPYKNLIFALLIGLNLLTIISVPADNTHMPYDDVTATASKGHDSKMAANIGIFYPHEWRKDGIIDEELTTDVVVSDMSHVRVYGYSKKGTKAQTSYVADADGNYIELPILNYYGYRAYDENGKRLDVIEGSKQRIRIMTEGDGKEHMVYIRFGPVASFVAADVISALTIAGIAYMFWRKRCHQRG